MFSAVNGAPSAWARWPASGMRRSAETPSKEMRTTGRPSRERVGSFSTPGLGEADVFTVVEGIWLVSEIVAGDWHGAEIGATARQKRRHMKTARAKTAGRRNWRREHDCRAAKCSSASVRTPRTAHRRGPDGAPQLSAGFFSKTISKCVRWKLSIPAQSGSGSTRALEGRRLGCF